MKKTVETNWHFWHYCDYSGATCPVQVYLSKLFQNVVSLDNIGFADHDISWSVMIGHDMSWYIIICHRMSWYAIRCLDMSWYVMICHDMSWHVMIGHDIHLIWNCTFENWLVNVEKECSAVQSLSQCRVCSAVQRIKVLTYIGFLHIFHSTARDCSCSMNYLVGSIERPAVSITVSNTIHIQLVGNLCQDMIYVHVSLSIYSI